MIYKQTLKVTELSDHFIAHWPQGAKPISVASQKTYEISVWYVCDPQAPLVNHHIHIRGTGIPDYTPPVDTFIGTVMVMDSLLVLHLFDGGEI